MKAIYSEVPKSTMTVALYWLYPPLAVFDAGMKDGVSLLSAVLKFTPSMPISLRPL